MNKFVMDERTLDQNLFNLEPPSKGPQTYLNINYLPYFMSHLLSKLTRKEKCCIIEFDIQTFVLELCLYNLKYKCVKDMANGLLRELRMQTKFWISNSEAQNDVQLRIRIFQIAQKKLLDKAIELNTEQTQQDYDLDLMRRYVSQLDFDKLDFKNESLKYQEVQDIIKAKRLPEDSSSKQIEAVNKYNQYLQEVTKIKNDGYIYQHSQPEDNEKNKKCFDQNNLPGNVFDWMSRCNAFDFNAQRETRQQSRSMLTSDVLSHRDIRVLIREQQRIEMENKRTLWVPNQIYRYQKIDIVILPYVYQFFFLCKLFRFIFKPQVGFDRRHLRVQNLILYLTMTDQEHQKTNKLKKNIMVSQEGDHKTSQKQFQQFLQFSNDKIMNDFGSFCLTNGISLASYFSSTPANYRKELVLLRNILLLSVTFAKTLVPEDVQYKLDDSEEIDQNNLLISMDEEQASKQPSNDEQQDESIHQSIENEVLQKKKNIHSYQKWKKNQNDYFYLQVLQQLELYYAIPPDQYISLVQTYIANIEIIYVSKKDHLQQYFSVLRQFQKNGIVGSFTSQKDSIQAVNDYIENIEAPTNQKKRSYIYHSSDRTEWTENEYKLFLEGLLKHFDIVVNNKRIAKHIGEDINPNHVRFIKGNYLRYLKKRSKDLNVNRKHLLKQDIETFDPSLFDFVKKKLKVQDLDGAQKEEEDDQEDDIISQVKPEEIEEIANVTNEKIENDIVQV